MFGRKRNMENERKKLFWAKIGVCLFFAVLLGFPVVSGLLPDTAISKSERRKLTQMPEFSMKAFMDGTYTEQLEEYRKDQFPGRDTLRTVKAETDIAIFGKSDSDGYYKVGDAIYQRKEELQEKNVRWAAEHFAEIAEKYFQDADVYYAVIPDKEEYLAVAEDGEKQEFGQEQKEKKSEMPAEGAEFVPRESEQAKDWMAESMPNATCISIWDTLSLQDYYRTDIHWRQEGITDTAELLVAGMNEGTGTAQSDKEIKIATEDFLGGNACASAFSVAPEALGYVTSVVIENAKVYDYEKKAQVSVYSREKLEEGTDPYDFYLWGARALLTIENPNAPEDAGKLILFRDSFGSSIAPLLMDSYAQITLVDLRYVTMEYAAELLGELDYDDVLFLYSTTMLNNSGSLRF